MCYPARRGLQESFVIEARGGWIPTTEGKYKRSDPTQLGPCYPRPAVAKRSPILGYNHNVRYRGLIFHVQTEDSGLLSPHLFTHLFYEGVIISTRKLVYDAGADEGAIKSLMQAQHKAVMKDLKRGAFDDKMDTNLAGNPGLLPRGTKEAGTSEIEPLRDSQPVIPMPQEFLTEPGIEIVRDSEPYLPPPIRAGTEPIEPMDESSATQPIEVLEEVPPPPRIQPRAATPPPIPTDARTKTPAPMIIQPRNAARTDTDVTTSRTITAEKQRGSGKVRVTLPPPPDDSIDPATIAEDPATLAAAMFATSSSARPFTTESAPEIEIVPEEPPRRRAVHDTEVEMATLSSIEDAPRVSDGIPYAPPPTTPPPMQRAPLSAATLPPSRPLTRPPSRPAITPPNVLSRPITSEQQKPRNPDESAAVEIYAPPPSGVDAPPGMGERPGQYAQYKRSRQFDAVVPPAVTPPPARERAGSSSSIPAGLGRPLRTPPGDSGSVMPPGRPLKPSTQGSQPIPRPVPRDNTPSTPPQSSASSGVPEPMGPQSTLPRGKPPTPNRERPPLGRSPTPQRIQSTQPIQRPVGSGGVVMTRPAVIVGAPAKAPTQRVRKAREEEGRGFGQGLISEKSLDEVILAYLSEDADDK